MWLSLCMSSDVQNGINCLLDSLKSTNFYKGKLVFSNVFCENKCSNTKMKCPKTHGGFYK